MRFLHFPCKGDAYGKTAAGSSFSAGSHLFDLESLYVFCLEALGAFGYRELYGLAFLQTAKSVCLNRREMHEDVVPDCRLIKPKPFASLNHFTVPCSICYLFHFLIFC